jgi:hypothetical protein
MIKNVVVNKYQKALVFNTRGEFETLLSAGSYWLFGKKTVFVCETDQEFKSPIDLNILLKDNAFAEAVECVDVKDNEIVLKFTQGILNAVLSTGRYVFWKGPVDYRFVRVNLNEVDIGNEVEESLLSNRLLAPYVRSFTVDAWEKGLLYLNGRFIKQLNSGTYFFWKNATTVQVYKTDVRMQQLEMSGQEILTKDKANVRMNAFATYVIRDVMKALADNKDFEKQLYVAAQLALREYTGSLLFDEMMQNKTALQSYVLNAVKERASLLGVDVLSFGIRDIILPGDMKEIMNQVLMAERKAQANSIMRREETAATRSLMNTAKLMEDNPMLYKLKEMEFVEKIADNINSINKRPV